MMIIRVFCCLLMLLPLRGMCDSRSEELITELSKAFKQMYSYRVDFEVDMQAMGEIEGHYIVSGDKYFITTGENSIGSDGKCRYEVDYNKMEVNVDFSSTNKSDLLSNPANAFDFVSDQFTHTLIGQEVFDSQQCNVVELIPVDDFLPFKKVKLLLNAENNLPQKISYKLDGDSQTIDIYIKSVEKLKTVDQETFEFDEKQYSCYEIIDFR